LNETTGQLSFSPLAVFRLIVWWYFLAPIVVGSLVAYGTLNDFKGWSDHHVLKVYLEIIHPALLVSMFVVALQGFRFTRDFSFKWLCWLAFALLAREIHFDYSDRLIWVALAFLAYLAWRERARIASLFQSRKPLTLFLVAIACYGSSQVLDYLTEHGFSEWRIAWESNTEEALETLGGFILMLVPLFMRAADD
jgi:hypothetical protein